VRVLLDTNVILDVALRRQTLFDGSKCALEKCEVEAHEMFVSWHTLSNLFYILRRDRGAEKTIEFLRHLLSISTVSPVGHADALRAIGRGLNVFEDALQFSAAESCRADVILTRNKSDFGSMPSITVLTPEEFSTSPTNSPKRCGGTP
jgi:predicted nucleic acid-binding protein